MRIADFLNRDSCVASLASDSKESALKELCDLLCANENIENGDDVFSAVMNRERLGSTGVGDQVAIPHAKAASVKSLTAAFGVSKDGVDYGAIDDKPVRLIFLLLASGNATGEHLKALARISRLLKNEDFRREVTLVNSPDQIYEIIAREDEKRG